MTSETLNTAESSHAPVSETMQWETIQRHDRPLPRYTSYPTVPVWKEMQSTDAHAAYERSAESGGPVSIYVHLPFCERMCLYCGCNTIIAKRATDIDRYVEALDKEVRHVASVAGNRPLAQLHLGGGTPTMLSPDQLERMVNSVFAQFAPREGAEIGIEVDPVVTTEEHFKVAHKLGFNRISLGVQDFDDEVQRLVERNQWADITRQGFQWARDAGFEHINTDLMYGLPGQTVDHLRRSASEVANLGVERVAIFGYAHVPWMKPHQKKLEQYAMPEAQERWEMFEAAGDALREVGYEPIGLDHFALSSDELVHAWHDGRLNRNFQGYTVLEPMDLIGIGLSSIGDTGGTFLQNAKRLSGYYEAIESGKFATDLGMTRTKEDDLRRSVIISIMCNLRADYGNFETPGGFQTYFAKELEELKPLVDDGIVILEDDRLVVPEVARRFVRNVASIFDAYLGTQTKGQFSRSV